MTDTAMTSDAKTNATKPWTRWLLRLQFLLVFLMLLGIASHRFELLPFRLAFSGFGLALLVAFIVSILSLSVLVWSYIKQVTHWRFHSMTSAVIGLLPVVFVLGMVGPSGFGVPPIHDISTDTDTPPEFVAARKERKADENPLDYAGEGVAVVQHRAYPDIKPLLTSLDYIESYKRSLNVVKQLGWRLLSEDMEKGVIEATDQSAVFGFKDDIVIRISAMPDGSRVDTRSVSRVGVSDLGANAARIRRFQAAFAP